MQRTVFSAILISGLFFAGCDKPKPADRQELEQLRREMVAMKEQQSAASPATPAYSESTLSGLVFYRLNSGEAVILRASQVYLLTPNDVSDPQSGRDPTKDLHFLAVAAKVSWSADILMGEKSARRSQDQRLAELQKAASRALFKAKTDSEGRYTFRDFGPGNFYIFTTLNTTNAKGFWYQPVTVQPNRSVELDLDNSNITAVYDYPQ